MREEQAVLNVGKNFLEAPEINDSAVVTLTESGR